MNEFRDGVLKVLAQSLLDYLFRDALTLGEGARECAKAPLRKRFVAILDKSRIAPVSLKPCCEDAIWRPGGFVFGIDENRKLELLHKSWVDGAYVRLWHRLLKCRYVYSI